jgi:hypothetical protein
MSNLVDDIAGQALDAAGIPITMGDIEDGSEQARVMLRAYRQALQQLLRTAHWDFARFTAPLVMLADATGNTPNVGTQVPEGQFTFEYEYPIDAVKIRYVPWDIFQNPGAPPGNIVPPNNNAPIVAGLNPAPRVPRRIQPARFVIATDSNYLPPAGEITWETQGVSPQSRTVILTNVYNAKCVYTRLMLYPSNWDSLFREALVAYLASQVCLTLHKEKKLALAIRPLLIATAKEKIMQARVTNGNESGWNSSDIPVDWIQARNTGGGGPGFGNYGGGLGDGFGVCGFDSVLFSDGSSY